MLLRIGEKLAGVDDRPLRRMALELLRRGATEQLFHKQTVPRQFRDDADRHRVARVRAGKTIHHEQLAALQIGQHFLPQPEITFLGNRLVGLAPPNLVTGRRLFDDELVARRTPRPLARQRVDRATAGQHRFVPPHRLLDQADGQQIPMHLAGAHDAVIFQSILTHK